MGIPLHPEAIQKAKAQCLSKFGTHMKLAVACKLSEPTVHRFLKGFPVSHESFQIICDALALDYDELIQQVLESALGNSLVEKIVRNEHLPSQSNTDEIAGTETDRRFSIEILAPPQTLPLRCWKNLPDCQGIYSLFTPTWNGRIHLCASRHMRSALKADLQKNDEFRKLLEPDASGAWIVWGRYSDRALLTRLEQKIVQECERWMMDTEDLKYYDAEYDCEKGWCPYAVMDVPDSILQYAGF